MIIRDGVTIFCPVPAAASIKMRTICEQDGFIYMWYAAKNEQPDWMPPSLPKNYSYRGKNEFVAAAHIQVHVGRFLKKHAGVGDFHWIICSARSIAFICSL